MRDEQARTNQLDLILQQLITYYSTLKSIERERIMITGTTLEDQRRHRGANQMLLLTCVGMLIPLMLTLSVLFMGLTPFLDVN